MSALPSDYQKVESRLSEVLADTDNMTPSIRELARELNCTPKLINTKFVHLAGKLILKRKAEIKNINNRRTLNKEINPGKFSRVCLSCDSEFVTDSRFYRLCEACRRREDY